MVGAPRRHRVLGLCVTLQAKLAQSAETASTGAKWRTSSRQMLVRNRLQGTDAVQGSWRLVGRNMCGKPPQRRRKPSTLQGGLACSVTNSRVPLPRCRGAAWFSHALPHVLRTTRRPLPPLPMALMDVFRRRRRGRQPVRQWPLDMTTLGPARPIGHGLGHDRGPALNGRRPAMDQPARVGGDPGHYEHSAAPACPTQPLAPADGQPRACAGSCPCRGPGPAEGQPRGHAEGRPSGTTEGRRRGPASGHGQGHCRVRVDQLAALREQLERAEQGREAERERGDCLRRELDQAREQLADLRTRLEQAQAEATAARGRADELARADVARRTGGLWRRVWRAVRQE